MERQEVTAVILQDLSVAFDMVNHSLLLRILETRYGIVDHALVWYESYLSQRQLQVCVNSSYSEKLNIKYGVPQGSRSGTNNFITYCTPIEDVQKKAGGP